MKKSVLTITFLISGLFVASLLVSGCGGKKEQADHQHVVGDSTHLDDMNMDSTQTTYACPMHPEEAGKEGDTCSKCAMKLEQLKSVDSTEVHEGHQH